MILGSFNGENNMHSNKTQAQHKETRDTKNFPRGNHKGENPATSSEIESTPKVKPQNNHFNFDSHNRIFQRETKGIEKSRHLYAL